VRPWRNTAKMELYTARRQWDFVSSVTLRNRPYYCPVLSYYKRVNDRF
jgi:hypothetical protein